MVLDSKNITDHITSTKVRFNNLIYLEDLNIYSGSNFKDIGTAE
jgi:hypothetical protein